MTLEIKTQKKIQEGYRKFLKNNGLRPRLGQKQMISLVANTVGDIKQDTSGQRNSDNGICVVEAGTGTGKTIAYLLSTLPLARLMGKQVVISTGTVALQEQLVNKDIPMLLKSADWDYSVSLVKGRGRYLCPLRLEQYLDGAKAKESGVFLFDDETNFNPSESIIKKYHAMDKSINDGAWRGDRDSWSDIIEDTDWRPLTVNRSQCAGRKCRHIAKCCFFKARDDIEKSECIVANHDLVMADLALGGGVILPAPEDTIYIFDEAHKISSTAINHFSSQCRLKSSANWLGQVKKQISVKRLLFKDTPTVQEYFEKIGDAADISEKLIGLSYPVFEKYIEKNDAGKSLCSFSRGDPGDEIREISENISKELNTFSNLTKMLAENLTDVMDDPYFPIPRVDLEQLFQQVGAWQGRAESIKQLWQSYSQSPHYDLEAENNAIIKQYERSPSARWLSIEESNLGNIDICLSSSPTDAGGILQVNLWKHCYSAILTSATLRTLGSFNSFTKNVGLLGNSDCKAVEGAFDFLSAGSLVIPDIGVDASDSVAHTEALIKKLPQLIDCNEGTLVLFSSRRQMESVLDGLSGEFKKSILTQGQFTHQEIVYRHKQAIDKNNGSIIFGLASFAEGMDFPGDYCRHVIIAKIPFSVPDDPIYTTLSEWIEEQGGNPFMDLMLPEASIRLHQACGRLIRSETDTGKVTILDRRILTKRYGEKLLADLPPFSRKF